MYLKRPHPRLPPAHASKSMRRHAGFVLEYFARTRQRVGDHARSVNPHHVAGHARGLKPGTEDGVTSSAAGVAAHDCASSCLIVSDPDVSGTEEKKAALACCKLRGADLPMRAVDGM